jgi:hypothetical protein
MVNTMTEPPASHRPLMLKEPPRRNNGGFITLPFRSYGAGDNGYSHDGTEWDVLLKNQKYRELETEQR